MGYVSLTTITAVIVSSEDSSFEIVPLTPEKVLELVEAAYPNPVNPEDLAK